MKKQIFFMALVGAALTACSNHDFDVMSEAEIAQAKYEAAFVQRFGQPDANHTWGFGDVTRSVKTRAITPEYVFPGDADASNFLTAVPEGVELYKTYNQPVSYVDETFSGEKIELNGSWDNVAGKNIPCTLYVKGNVDLSSIYFYANSGTEIYVIEGATLKLPVDGNNITNIQQNCKVYLAKDAKLITTGELKLNSAFVYNHGAIEANKLTINGNGLLYNNNTSNVNVSGAISVDNGESILVNDGYITGASLQTAGSGKVQNNGTATISGETLINSNVNTWVNNGQYTTGYFKFNAMSDQVVNNCRLTINEKFSITLGDGNGGIFRMDGNAGVVAKDFEAIGPFRIEMGAGSVFKVTGTAVFNAAKADYGVYGLGSDYAVFQANKIEAGKAEQGYEVTYGGKLYVVANTTHFENGLSGSYPYIDFKNGCTENNIYENGDIPAITINETECNPGFKGNITTPSGNLRVIAEDLTVAENGDFDFNDVVFDIILSDPANNGNTTIILQAAGGTLPLYVAGKEVHEAFGVGTNVMVNTKAANGVTKEPVTIRLDMKYDKAIDVPVMVKKSSDEMLNELIAGKGKVPSKIGVPVSYEWCDEREDIATKYPKFTDYVNNEQANKDWYIK